MLTLEYKLRLSPVQETAIDEAIRTTQFIRTPCVRLWMDGRDVSAKDPQRLCARLAQELAVAARPTSDAQAKHEQAKHEQAPSPPVCRAAPGRRWSPAAPQRGQPGSCGGLRALPAPRLADPSISRFHSD